jgi:ATP-binding cassette subfamily B protein
MEQERNVAATKLAVKHYLHQFQLDWKLFLPGFLLPTIGTTLVQYVPTLIVADVLVKFSQKSYTNLSDFIPYVLLLALTWGSGQFLFRIGNIFAIKAQVRGLERLYNNAMEYLLTKDIAFFHDNFTGSLTKKVVGYTWKYSDLNGTLLFQVIPNYLPIILVVIILWQFSAWLVLVLVGLMLMTGYFIFPLIKKRQRHVAAREIASNKATGHVADIIGNIDAVKSFANEDLEFKNHTKNVKDLMIKARRSWDYQNLTVQTVASPFYVLINVIGLFLALAIGGDNGISIAAVFITFSFYARITDLMWDFNDVYRNIESAVTEAA